MNGFWSAIFRHSFPHALSLLLIGIACMVMPDILLGLGFPLRSPLPNLFIRGGVGIAVVGYLALILSAALQIFEEEEGDNGARQKMHGKNRQYPQKKIGPKQR
jgi:hypothetical protein